MNSKKIGTMALAGMVFLAGMQIVAQDGPQIIVNQQVLNTQAFIQDGTTYVPLRAVSEALGANVEWNGETNSVIVETNGTTEAIPRIIEMVGPSVVGIMGPVKSGASASYQDAYSGGIALGTGVIIKSGGEILTNAHVVGDMENIIVVLSDGNGYEARLKYIDYKSDLAVIKIEKLGLTVAKFADPSQLTTGQTVVALGTPLSLSLRNSASSGIISGLNRAIDSEYTLIQTDASINPGNSGGPLVNMNGEVVGINSSKYAGVGIEGMCFSIPVGTVKYVLNHFDTYGRVRRPDLGVTFEEGWAATLGLPTTQGISLKEIKTGGPAQKAGLSVGDIIEEINGQPIHSIVDWNEAMKQYLPGQECSLKVKTIAETKNVTVVFDEE